MAVLFDLDGTLTDPKPGIAASVRYALDRLGVEPPSWEDMDTWIGPPIQGSFKAWIGGDPGEAVRLYRQHYGQIGLLENSVHPGIRESLDRLREEEIPLYVATSKPQVFAQRILDHFELSPYFERVYGSELEGQRSAKDDLIRFLLASEGLPARRAIMVGDREHDVLGARSNGLPCLGVTYGYGEAEDLDEAGAVALCDRPEDVGATVVKLFGTLALSCEGA